MRLAVTYPHMLWLLLFVPPLLWLAWRAPRPARRGRKLAAILLRGLLFTLLVLALAGLQVRRPVEDTAVVFLIDVSDSIPPADEEAAIRFVRRALQTRDAQDVAGVVVFGKNALVERLVGALDDLPGIESIPVRTRTDIRDVAAGAGVWHSHRCGAHAGGRTRSRNRVDAPQPTIFCP